MKIPIGYCQCGCGQKTTIAPVSHATQGYVKGVPRDFIVGHNNRVRPRRPLQERFWEKVNMGLPNECWEWKVCRTGNYPKVLVGGKMVQAKRISYAMAYGTIEPATMIVCHTCDNPKCVNPKHLFLGTLKDNFDDMVRKGRRVYGDMAAEKNPAAKLNSKSVKEIRKLYKGGVNQPTLAKKYRVSQVCISQVILRKTWKNIR